VKKVLVVAYLFPPSGGGGVMRTLKFIKYLPQLGWRPDVITVKNPVFDLIDRSLLDEIPSDVHVYRTYWFDHRLFSVPLRKIGINPSYVFIPHDMNIGWLPFAIKRGKKIIEKKNIDIIYATYPPAVNVLIGSLLKVMTGKPLVLDFRDPWTQNPFVRYLSIFQKKVEEWMEKACLRSAEHVITVTEHMRQNLIKKYPFISEKCVTITNGFDPEDFEDLKRWDQRNKFTITYTGSLYGLRTPIFFLTALKKIVEENNEIKNSIQVIFVGRYSEKCNELVRKLGLEKVVNIFGFTSHKKSLEFMVNADVLLLIITGGKYIMTNKIFEYLYANRPILALVPEDGPAGKLIRSTNSGLVISPYEIDSIKNGISRMFERWKKENSNKPNKRKNNISRYSRKTLTYELVNVFEKVYCARSSKKH